MTIEIKQLVIRAVVEPAREPAPAAAAPAPRPGPGPGRLAPRPPAAGAVNLDALIAECTRQVLRELRKQRDR